MRGLRLAEEHGCVSPGEDGRDAAGRGAAPAVRVGRPRDEAAEVARPAGRLLRGERDRRAGSAVTGLTAACHRAPRQQGRAARRSSDHRVASPRHSHPDAARCASTVWMIAGCGPMRVIRVPGDGHQHGAGSGGLEDQVLVGPGEEHHATDPGQRPFPAAQRAADGEDPKIRRRSSRLSGGIRMEAGERFAGVTRPRWLPGICGCVSARWSGGAVPGVRVAWRRWSPRGRRSCPHCRMRSSRCWKWSWGPAKVSPKAATAMIIKP